MGFPKKKAADSGLDSDGKKWAVAGISIKPLKPVNTKGRGGRGTGCGEEEERSTTPTARESRIPEKLPCPPAPRKRRPPAPSRCGGGGGGREFFTPPDLDSVFKCYVEKAN